MCLIVYVYVQLVHLLPVVLQKPVDLPKKHPDGARGDFFVLSYKRISLRGSKELTGMRVCMHILCMHCACYLFFFP